MWLFLCFQKIQFRKDQELRIQDLEGVILLFYHLRQLLTQFFSLWFLPSYLVCGKGQGPGIKKPKTLPYLFLASGEGFRYMDQLNQDAHQEGLLFRKGSQATSHTHTQIN